MCKLVIAKSIFSFSITISALQRLLCDAKKSLNYVNIALSTYTIAQLIGAKLFRL